MQTRRTNFRWILYVVILVLFTGAMISVAIGQQNANQLSQVQPQAVVIQQQEKPRIQMAILLDTSSSMDGLIDQTRNQLWQVVNEFNKAKRNGVTPDLEVAVYEYGNNNLDQRTGYIRQVVSFTPDLDRVSEALFSLTTNGGDEYCGYAIQTAVNDLQWSQSERDIKVLFIAGNEPFTQGSVSFKEAINQAKARDITVNTIHAGPYDEGIEQSWQAGALLAGGNYMNINQDHQVVHIVAPQDQEIAELNQQLNETYVPYGSKGVESKERQIAQDSNSSNISIGMLAKRAKTKASSFYDSSEWDLVDALEKNKLDMDDVKKEMLPSALQPMTEEEVSAYVTTKADERKEIKAKLAELVKERDVYVQEQKKELAEAESETIENALISSVKKQAEKKQYNFQ